MYAPLACGGSLNGRQFVDADTLARMAAVSSASEEDALLLAPTRFSLGFHKSMDRRRLPPGQQGSLIMAEEAFGHVGAGGSLGFADPRACLSFGFAMNRMGAGAMLSDRCQALVDAAYRSLGYTSNASGSWR
jgi:CubicO group peptidase (beta-lactamase class C family)